MYKDERWWQFMSDFFGIPLITLWPFILVVVAGALVWWWL